MSQLHPIQHDHIMLLTHVTKNRRAIFLHYPFAYDAIETMYSVQNMYLFHIFAFVVMPDHVHMLLLVPSPGSVSKIMNIWKGIVSYHIGSGSIWQRGFHMRIVRQPEKTKWYIHNNPVKAGLVDAPEKYPWSSASGKWDITPMP